MNLLDDYVKRIQAAKVYDVAIKSPLEKASNLSRRLNNTVLLKREDLQPVFSFKLRGAYNRIRQLDEAALARGVIAASAGNHAQGVALSARKLGAKALIVMPTTTPNIKVEAVQSLGGETLLYGDTYDEACEYALKISKEKGMAFVHAYDEPEVIAGQGTVAVELLEQAQQLDAVFIPVGGGGLAAGMAVYIKSQRPDVKIIAVEPEDAACLAAALKAGKRVDLPFVGLFADGVAVKKIGECTFDVLRHVVDDVVTVTTDEICAAVKDVFEDTRVLAEPAGALSLAGLKKYVECEKCQDQNLACVVSGANVNFDRLRHIAERADIGEDNEVLFAVTIPEKKGSFKQFCQLLGKRGITEFNYRFTDSHEAKIFVGVAMNDAPKACHDLLVHLKSKDYDVVDLTDNSVAKLHIRYMVGGASDVPNEMLFRFQFPERPGALLKFLECVGTKWNISLFHYRNHGAAYGRVLVGMQIPDAEYGDAKAHFDELGYAYWSETENPAYQLFLK